MTSSSNCYSKNTDEELALLSREGNAQAQMCLLERYTTSVRAAAASLVSSFAVSHSLLSLDFDDLVQEGLLGLVSAIYSYESDKGATFKTYSSKCISNAIKGAIKSATRKKDIPAGELVSLNDIDIASADSLEENIISNENTDNLHSFLNDELSQLELSVFRYHISGESYKNISSHLGISEKSVDNALQRIKGKLSKFLNENES